ncbi:hypothetical protein IH992_05695 [Candidatus Poribacteria bacterium]|nr:hypothetical protein [Candidatus Poribacteria bacterium]
MADEAAKLPEIVKHVRSISPNIKDIVKETVCREIAKLGPQATLYPMGLWDLNSPKYKLKVPIHVVVEEWPDNEFIAHWHDVEAIGFGEGKQEVLEALQQDIIDLYEDLKNTDDNCLGKLTFKAKQILQTAIEEVTS